jgi:hypothetical protein
MPSPLRFLTVLAISAAAVVALAATASADSIAYVKDGNVWLTSPDAAKQYQLTFDGGYSSLSQADDGTIVALRARQFVRMDRSGHQLNVPAKLALTVTRASGKAVKGSIRSAGKPGANTLRFKGRIGGHTLRPGRYRLTITARAMAGGGSAKATMAFRIVG